MGQQKLFFIQKYQVRLAIGHKYIYGPMQNIKQPEFKQNCRKKLCKRKTVGNFSFP